MLCEQILLDQEDIFLHELLIVRRNLVLLTPVFSFLYHVIGKSSPVAVLSLLE